MSNCPTASQTALHIYPSKNKSEAVNLRRYMAIKYWKAFLFSSSNINISQLDLFKQRC
jgi:hypothetical protein